MHEQTADDRLLGLTPALRRRPLKGSALADVPLRWMEPMKKTIAPFGMWPSPIAPADLTRGARGIGHRAAFDGWLYWTESRPEEKGRQVLMRSKTGAGVEELLPPPFSARSRVHEYGGAEFTPTAAGVFFVNDQDQDVWHLVAGRTPTRLTDEPGMRFSDLVLDARRDRLIAVAERHRGTENAQPENVLVAIPLTGPRRGTVEPLARARDFYAFPCLSPCGARLAFIGWDLPDMPWDQSALYVASVRDSGELGRPKRIAGRDGVAAMQPVWLANGHLAYVEDSTGWGNISVWDGLKARPLTRLEADLGLPMWNLGTRSFVHDAEGRLHASTSIDGKSAIVTISDTERRKPVIDIREVDASAIGALAALPEGLAATLARPSAPAALVVLPFSRKAPRIVRASSDLEIDRAGVSVGREVRFRGGDGKTSIARYYPPTSSTHRGPSGVLPPALVLAHGGPTASGARGLNLRIQFYASRGFAILDVDYAGSTGYGRDYRARLDGQWGIADVADCAAGALWLGREGLADPSRVAIAGGSAGGFTTLMALATTEAFAAGSSHYGISDLALLMEHTHKFEAGYLHRLLGTTARSWKKTCEARSPLSHIDGITVPVILFQGLEDKVVPPEQSRSIARKLEERGIPVELHEFPGEAHGFRQAKTIVAVLEAELAFLRKSLGLVG